MRKPSAHRFGNYHSHSHKVMDFPAALCELCASVCSVVSFGRGLINTQFVSDDVTGMGENAHFTIDGRKTGQFKYFEFIRGSLPASKKKRFGRLRDQTAEFQTPLKRRNYTDSSQFARVYNPGAPHVHAGLPLASTRRAKRTRITEATGTAR